MAGYIDNSSDLALFESYAQGRALAGARLENLSNFAQWSALLDGKTCDWCNWADMRVFDRTTEPYDPPMHHGCRCLVAYITNDEFPPEPDWGGGPPQSSWPPGTYGECAKLRALAESLSEACIPAELGKAPKPKTGKEKFIKTDEAGMKGNVTKAEQAEIQDAGDALAGVEKYSDIPGAKKMTVSPDDLTATQAVIDADRVEEIAKRITTEGTATSDIVGEGVLVFEKSGKLFVVDGHHRAAAAYREALDLEAWVINTADL